MGRTQTRMTVMDNHLGAHLLGRKIIDTCSVSTLGLPLPELRDDVQHAPYVTSANSSGRAPVNLCC